MRRLVAWLIPAVLMSGGVAGAQNIVIHKAGARTSKPAANVWAVNHEVAQPTPPAAVIGTPVAHAPESACAGGCCGRKEGHKCCFWDWLCHRRSVDRNKGCGCCYYCAPPLYSYFGCDCREGAHNPSVPPKPCPPSCSTCGWGKASATGHRMFASPAGHGVCGVR